MILLHLPKARLEFQLSRLPTASYKESGFHTQQGVVYALNLLAGLLLSIRSYLIHVGTSHKVPNCRMGRITGILN
jgi:hypothetical protein